MALPLTTFSQYDWPNPSPIDQGKTYLLNGALFLTTFEQVIDPGRGDCRDGPDWYQSWESWYNKNLIGKDQLPTLLTSTALPPAYSSVESYPYRFWSFGPPFASEQTPFVQSDWPTPRGVEPDWRRSWEWWYKPYYIGQDKFPRRQMDWPNPVPPFRLDQAWTFTFIKELFGKDKLPRNQDDFPLPVPPNRLDQFIGAFYNQNLIGKDKLPRNQKDWPNPIPPFRPEQTYTAWYNQGLIGKDKLPIRNSYPIPPPLEWYRDWSQRYINLISVLGLIPKEYPIIRGPVDPYRSYEFAYNQNLIGQDKLPNRQQDWPNPYPVQWYREWAQNLKEVELNVPFNQLDWPNPYPVQWYQDWNQNSQFLLAQPFSQTDWPLPYPVQWYNWWFNNPLENGIFVQLPFFNQDWPNPYPVQWYQDWSQNIVRFAPPPLKPFPPFSDFPNPYPVQWYQDFNQNLNLLFPAPPPPPTPALYMAGLFSSHALHGHSGHIQTGDQN